jgi:polysaccharide deacetylase 2 family uncharacterized protein YibQ
VAAAAKRGKPVPAARRPGRPLAARLLPLAWLLLAAVIASAVALTWLDPTEPPPDIVVVAELPPVPPPPAAPAAPAPPAPPQPTATPAPDPSAPATPTPATPPAAPEPAPAPTAAPPSPPAPAATATSPATPPGPRPPTATPPQTAAAPAARIPAWTRYRRPFDDNDRRPRIAVVVAGLGLTTQITEDALRTLPGGVTLTFSPLAPRIEEWVERARRDGHEVLLDLAMEPTNFPQNDPGPRTLLTSLTPQQNLERLDWVLGRVDGVVGVAAVQGSRFSATPEVLRPVLAALASRGLMILDTRATPRSVIPRLASEIGLPRAIADRTIDIDNETSRVSIDARLAEIERIAREGGTAVAIAQSVSPVMLERLAVWLPTLQDKSLALAPVTAVVSRQRDR